MEVVQGELPTIRVGNLGLEPHDVFPDSLGTVPVIPHRNPNCASDQSAPLLYGC
ncbi:predicted protein [Plenodomus lingam JN3]|uniref:Predicted protein n=1 Tax=Leptosphaeria maculans (strain JN3 / isolate v23.1.3 / race Av1-4-5-6-7-8) TaxID=985895 RepID=E5ACV6_LEPMJ|nr:predicted protein [Plenodomus lingam JN3]CBY02308.1 predicted protein [Plenodomus lingam JN3]